MKSRAKKVRSNLAKPPSAGWCRTSHRPPKAAQSGYDGYCKPCFRLLFPKKHAVKLKGRLKPCQFCHEIKDIQKNGFCKTCTRARSCDSCGTVNEDTAATVCVSCGPTRISLARGVGQERLALWCASCCSESERASAKCRACFAKVFICHHCERKEFECAGSYHCSVEECLAAFQLCLACSPLTLGRSRLQCKSCWYSCGKLCIFACGSKGQHGIDMMRTCKQCIYCLFCKKCHMPPTNLVHRQKCHACDRLAMWCGKHFSELQLSSGCCEAHFIDYESHCQHCPNTHADAELVWVACSSTACAKFVRACARCREELDTAMFLCHACFTATGRMCLKCRINPARHETKVLPLLCTLYA